MQGRQLLLYLSDFYKGNWDKIFDHIKARRELGVDNDYIINKADNYPCDYVTLLDEAYPEDFKKMMTKAPFVLYYKGDLELIRYPLRLAVVGSRDASDYGIEATEKLIKPLPEEVVIISGLAKGIDRVAMEMALDSGKKVIGVVANGVDIYYPKENTDLYKRIIDEGGLILSEYPLGTTPVPETFRQRNRIVAALGNALLLGEGHGQSGTRITINYALDYGKTVCAIPYPIETNCICNEVIKQGATLVENDKDLLEALNFEKI